MEKIGRTLGTLLEIDEDIIEGDLYTYARLKIVAVKTIPSSMMLLSVNGEWKQQIEVENEIRDCSRCGSLHHNTDKCILFVRKAFGRPPRKPKQVWKEKEENMESETLFLDGPKSANIELKQVASSETPAQDNPLDNNTNMKMFPIEIPTIEVAL